jgi:hypothetical protein
MQTVGALQPAIQRTLREILPPLPDHLGQAACIAVSSPFHGSIGHSREAASDRPG